MIEKSSKGLNMIRFPSEQHLILFLHPLTGESKYEARFYKSLTLRASEHQNATNHNNSCIKGFISAFFRELLPLELEVAPTST